MLKTDRRKLARDEKTRRYTSQIFRLFYKYTFVNKFSTFTILEIFSLASKCKFFLIRIRTQHYFVKNNNISLKRLTVLWDFVRNVRWMFSMVVLKLLFVPKKYIAIECFNMTTELLFTCSWRACL